LNGWLTFSMNTKRLQLIIKGRYINKSNFVKPTLNLHTYEIQFLMLVYIMIFLNTTFTKDDNVQIHAYTKDVWYLCLFGHIIRLNLDIYGVEFVMWSNYCAHLPHNFCKIWQCGSWKMKTINILFIQQPLNAHRV